MDTKCLVAGGRWVGGCAINWGGRRVEIGEGSVSWGQFVVAEKLWVRNGGGAGDIRATQSRAVPAPYAPVVGTGRQPPEPSVAVEGTGRLFAGLCDGKMNAKCPVAGGKWVGGCVAAQPRVAPVPDGPWVSPGRAAAEDELPTPCPGWPPAYPRPSSANREGILGAEVIVEVIVEVAPGTCAGGVW